jgi:hypothetical protein
MDGNAMYGYWISSDQARGREKRHAGHPVFIEPARIHHLGASAQVSATGWWPIGALRRKFMSEKTLMGMPLAKTV